MSQRQSVTFKHIYEVSVLPSSPPASQRELMWKLYLSLPGQSSRQAYCGRTLNLRSLTESGQSFLPAPPHRR